MENVSIADRLLFFKTERYEYHRHHLFDVSGAPRPHFCMGLILEGRGVFRNAADGDVVEVVAGDIIFVPIGSRYVSEWFGEDRACYISMHFIFGTPAAVSREQNFKLQKVSLPDFPALRAEFEAALHGTEGEGAARLSALAALYRVLSLVLPHLKTGEHAHIDPRISDAIAYIEEHCAEPIDIETLATVARMSPPRFFPAFKEALGVSPVVYLNRLRVERASLLLLSNREESIERISEAVGFSSATYFRRVFRAATGKTPRAYRSDKVE